MNEITEPALVRWVRIARHRIWMASLWGQVAHWKEECRIAREDHRTTSKVSKYWLDRCRDLSRNLDNSEHQLNKCKDELRKKTEELNVLAEAATKLMDDKNQLHMSYNELREQSDEHLKAREALEEELQELETLARKIGDRDQRIILGLNAAVSLLKGEPTEDECNNTETFYTCISELGNELLGNIDKTTP